MVRFNVRVRGASSAVLAIRVVAPTSQLLCRQRIRTHRRLDLNDFHRIGFLEDARHTLRIDIRERRLVERPGFHYTLRG